MTLMSRWLVSVAVLGGTAAVMAAALLWLLLTRPVALVQALGHTL